MPYVGDAGAMPEINPLGNLRYPIPGGSVNLGTPQAMFGGAAPGAGGGGAGFMADITKPWLSYDSLDQSRASMVGGSLDAPFTAMSDDTAGRQSNVEISATRIIQKPPELQSLSGVYPPGALVWIKRDANTSSVYRDYRRYAPSLVPKGHELRTIQIQNFWLARRALADDGRAANTKYDLEDVCDEAAFEGAIHSQPEGDSGAPAGAYLQGSQTITADVLYAGPARIWDIWNTQALKLHSGSPLFLIMKKVRLPDNPIDFKFALDPRGAPAVSTDDVHSKLRAAGVTMIFQMIPYAPAASSRGFACPPLQHLVYRDGTTGRDSLRTGAVFSVGRINHPMYLSRASNRWDASGPFVWKEHADTRELGRMLADPQIDVLMNAHRCLTPI